MSRFGWDSYLIEMVMIYMIEEMWCVASDPSTGWLWEDALEVKSLPRSLRNISKGGYSKSPSVRLTPTM